MTRALTHIGLAIAIVLAPTLCCCKSRWLAPTVQAANVSVLAQFSPNTLPQPVEGESCCAKRAKACCSHPEPAQTPRNTGTEQPAPRQVPECACCAERPDAALTETITGEVDPRPSGEYLSLAIAGIVAGYDTHPSRVREAKPPERAGVDARYESLFLRHVLRC